MELNKAKIILSILKRNFGNEFLHDKDNIYILILLLERYNCMDISVLSDTKINDFKKLKLYLEKAEQKILINTSFRHRYLNIEENIGCVI